MIGDLQVARARHSYITGWHSQLPDLDNRCIPCLLRVRHPRSEADIERA